MGRQITEKAVIAQSSLLRTAVVSFSSISLLAWTFDMIPRLVKNLQINSKLDISLYFSTCVSLTIFQMMLY